MPASAAASLSLVSAAWAEEAWAHVLCSCSRDADGQSAGAQHLHEVLDEQGEGENGDMRSLDQLAPRLQLADALLVVRPC